MKWRKTVSETTQDVSHSSGCQLQVCTFVTKPDQYRSMLESMRAAGFDDAHCRFTAFENLTSNLHDPYRVIPKVLQDGPEPYVLFVHQDVLTDRGASFDDLIAALDRL